MREGSDRGARVAVGTLAILLVITAAWWALALWPAPGETPEWLARARQVCFGAADDGLPDASGWLLLIGQPLGMLGLLVAGWGAALRRGLVGLAGSWPGRSALAAGLAAVAVGLGAAGVRVAEARGTGAAAGGDVRAFFDHELPPPTYPRIDRPAPTDVLVDQDGEPTSMERFRGRPVLVTFAFGHCETVCPLVVQQARRARELLAPALDPALVVITLDPWRDTPSRLPHLVEGWGLGEDAYVLSGEVEQVEAALDAWSVARRRDPATGDVVHPALVYLVDPDGVIAYATNGSPEAIVELARRM